MVNANVVISVSAVLVALILTLVVVLRSDGDPEDNFSVSVTGSYVSGGTTYNTAMYYCTGQSCRFYDALKDTDDFPGYFALVGFTGSDGFTYVTEHSIGKTFIFNNADGTLKECRPVDKLDSTGLSEQVSKMADAWNSDSNSFTSGGRTYTVLTHNVDSDPSDDTPSVLGYSVPTVDQCNTANGITFHTLNTEVRPDGPDARMLGEEQDVRHLATYGQTWANWASYGYDGGTPPQGASHYRDCIFGNVVGRVAILGGQKIVSFAGTNDFSDVIQDLSTSGHPVWHWGFWDYVTKAYNCIQDAGGGSAAYITGHSLGGAAATIYKQMSGSTGKVVTFGAPKTTKGKACSSEGVRIFNEVDPVASNGMGILGSFNHDVLTAKKAYFQSGACKSYDWWGFCEGYYPDVYGVKNANSCSEQATGCDWLVDCLYNVGTHSLDYYRKHSLDSVYY